MAVRNMEAINRQGEMIAQQRRNARQMREESFWNRVNMIKASHKDAVDFVDTVDALYKNGMGTKFEEWLKNQNVGYANYNKRMAVSCKVDCERKESAHVYYVPAKNSVGFGWNGYGMCESYTAGESDAEYLIHQRLSHHGYDEGLTKLAERLQPFLDAFFKWVETI